MASLLRAEAAPFHSRSSLPAPLPRFPAFHLASFRSFPGRLPCLHPSLPVFPSRHGSFSRSGRAQVASPGPPSPDPEDPFGDDSLPNKDIGTNFCKVRDGVQIFFAVLFWMSLFFWASAWDGNDSFKPKKKSWFRR
ncbi:hypothetical protein H6P81_000270 [Aristolochia fimbriata]|uniref:Uncharacterized protein n=1 Tax=Aristolochia fimbriata TaxID=158543 RepID=A0AAV7F7K3_ARIFI|nr:hypothetical protein H6P81_000270 [Aristolochia fimbriata]